MRFDATSASCHVCTFQEGLLSAVAHDLRIAVTRFTVALDADGSVDARFDATSLRVECAVRDGVDAPNVLSPRDRAEIDRNLAGEVLESRRFPEIRFRAVAGAVTAFGEGHRVTGVLSLHGREQALVVVSRRAGDRELAEVTLHQPDFGIRPFRALLGALRIRPDVRVYLAFPSPLPT